jgi:hypothetical protein
MGMVLLYPTHTLPIDILKLATTAFSKRPKQPASMQKDPSTTLERRIPTSGLGERWRTLPLWWATCLAQQIILEGSANQENDGDESHESSKSDDPKVAVMDPWLGQPMSMSDEG